MSLRIQQAAQTPKAEQTRRRILVAALQLFQERGFEETTMREVARKAGLATGAAYYYFQSKEELVKAFYDETQKQIQELSEKPLQQTRDLRDRLKTILDLKVQQILPYRHLLNVLFRDAANPQSPISPFGEETRAIRDESIDLFRKVMEGSNLQIPSDLSPHLPRLLWLYHMGIILFLIHDSSPGQIRTKRLIEKSLDLIVMAIRISRFRIMAPLRKRALELLKI